MWVKLVLWIVVVSRVWLTRRHSTANIGILMLTNQIYFKHSSVHWILRHPSLSNHPLNPISNNLFNLCRPLQLYPVPAQASEAHHLEILELLFYICGHASW